jgi:hypothetical protein
VSSSVSFAENVGNKTAGRPQMQVLRVYFKNLKDGDTISKEQKVVFGVEGMKIRPAGEDATDKKSGHHHLIIDGGFVPQGQVIPADATHLHFGKGQTETMLKLTPGPHTLTLQFADGAHRSYGESMSATIHVTVK